MKQEPDEENLSAGTKISVYISSNHLSVTSTFTEKEKSVSILDQFKNVIALKNIKQPCNKIPQ